jgi:hypothetical protein
MTKYAKRGSRADATKPADEPITEPANLKLIEVELARKYAPIYCYEAGDSDALVMALNEDGKASPQAKIVVGEKLDKFNKTVPVYKEINDTYPAGTVIPLPSQEAQRALREGIARITDRTFS